MSQPKKKEVIDITSNAGAAESYRVCLKMLFVDLQKLNNPTVNKILKHYGFEWTDLGRIGLTLPKFFKE